MATTHLPVDRRPSPGSGATVRKRQLVGRPCRHLLVHQRRAGVPDLGDASRASTTTPSRTSARCTRRCCSRTGRAGRGAARPRLVRRVAELVAERSCRRRRRCSSWSFPAASASPVTTTARRTTGRSRARRRAARSGRSPRHAQYNGETDAAAVPEPAPLRDVLRAVCRPDPLATTRSIAFFKDGQFGIGVGTHRAHDQRRRCSPATRSAATRSAT